MSRDVSVFGRIGVLMGGYSSERKISLKSGRAIYEALKSQGYDVVALDITDREESRITDFIAEANINIAFIALHGHLGEDGAIQAILEKLAIPYTGSDPKANHCAFDKSLTQKILKRNDILIPECVLLSKDDQNAATVIRSAWDFSPTVIKPACEGSSIGIEIVHDKDELECALERAWDYGPHVLFEQYIPGRECTVSILRDQSLPVVEICPKRDFFDFTAKYEVGQTHYIVPAQFSKNVTLDLQQTAYRAHIALGCKDFSRVDFILSEDDRPYVLELNTIPGFTQTSLLPKAALAAGISFNQLCHQLVEYAYAKKKKENHSTQDSITSR
jgi:D-alanine-D-alanine ligase